MRLIFLLLSKSVIFPNFRVEFTQKKFYEIDFLLLSKSVIFPNFRVEFTQKKFYEIGSWESENVVP